MRLCHLFSKLKIPPNDSKQTQQDQNFIKILTNQDVLRYLSQNELTLEKPKLKERLEVLLSQGKIKFPTWERKKAKIKNKG